MRIGKPTGIALTIFLSTIGCLAQADQGQGECRVFKNSIAGVEGDGEFTRECDWDEEYPSKDTISKAYNLDGYTVRKVTPVELPGQSLFLDPYFIICKSDECSDPINNYFSIDTSEEAILSKVLHGFRKIALAAANEGKSHSSCVFDLEHLSGIVPYEHDDGIGLTVGYSYTNKATCTLSYLLKHNNEIISLPQ